jgi:DNA-binding NarL/FixJ family response regulator
VAGGDGTSPPDRLSPREHQILSILAQGATNKEIGRALHISEKTVRNHLCSVYRKMGVRSRAQAIVKAARIERTGDT